MAGIDRIKFNGHTSKPHWLVYKFPSECFPLGSQLIVSQGQEALFLNDGEVLSLFGPGTYTLSTEKLPLLHQQIKHPFGDQSTLTAEVYYINKTAKLDLHWGTSTAIPLEDPKYGLILNVGAYGQYGVTISDSRLFISRIVGAIPDGATGDYTVIPKYFNSLIATKIKSIISEYMIKEQISFLEISLYLSELSDTLKEAINDEFKKFGVEVVNFFCESIAPHPKDYEKLRHHRGAFHTEQPVLNSSPSQSEVYEMPLTATIYDLLISCPSDVAPFLRVIEDVVLRFNATYGKNSNIVIRPIHWSKNVYPESGGRPQELINRQIVDSAHIAIGIFWTRFGEPTGCYNSGTEEEIKRLLQKKKQVFLYFLDKPVPPSCFNNAQYKKIQNFKTQHQGVYWSVSDETDLSNKFYDHLMMYFNGLARRDSLYRTAKNMQILWVDDHPGNNTSGRALFEQYGIETILALSTDQALAILASNHSIALIISDMERREGPREGYVLLDAIRKIKPHIPFYFFTSSKKPEHIEESLRRGAQGHTNDFDELADLVIKTLSKGRLR